MRFDFSYNITREVYEAACRLFDEMWDGTPLRHLGVHTGRDRFGMDAVQRASFLEQEKIDHMSGGISRKKRIVDYKKEKVM